MNKIDFQGLLDVIKAAENESQFDMRTWESEHPCGTTHCMIGAFCVQANENEPLKLVASKQGSFIEYESKPALVEFASVAFRFGISTNEACWLFGNHPLRFSPRYCSKRTLPATSLRKSEAIKRLRKFIYYKLKKQEMVEEKGRNGYLVDHGKVVGGNSAAVRSLEMAQ